MKFLVTLALSFGACGLAALIPFERLPPPAVEHDTALEPPMQPTAAAAPRPAPPSGPEAATSEGKRAMRNLDLIQRRFEILREAHEGEGRE